MVFWKNDDDRTSHGTLRLVVGGSGGPKIITSVVQVLMNACFLGMPLVDAVMRPRVHDQLLYHGTAVTTTERSVAANDPSVHLTVSNETKQALLSRGHASLVDIDYAGTVQAVGIDLDRRTLSAVSDPRKGGTPAGY